MSEVDSLHPTRRYLPLLLVLFVGSGCAALIYEIVWFQLLEFVIGSSAISLGVLLGTFMGGMCFGSYFFARFVSGKSHPLATYAKLEVGIGLIALVLLFLPSLLNVIYVPLHATGMVGLVIRAIIAGVCLLPPTFLMGATLPAISRWVETTPAGVSWLGFFYGGNIAGAVIGSLLAGYYLLRVHDLYVATFVALGLNLLVAFIAYSISKKTPHSPPSAASVSVKPAEGAGTVYLTIALSGMTALASEVLWTRHLSLLIGATVYAFSLILAVFLFGLGIGSSLGSAMASKLERPRLALGWCQMALCGAMAWSAYLLTQSMPFWPIDPQLSAGSPWVTFQIDIVRAMWAVVPGSILWGMSFPLALAAVANKGQDPARLVGGVYAANTVGAIVGAMAASLFMVSTLGSRVSEQVLVVVSAIAGLLAAAPVLVGSDSTKKDDRLLREIMLVILPVVVALIVLPETYAWYLRIIPAYIVARAAIFVLDMLLGQFPIGAVGLIGAAVLAGHFTRGIQEIPDRFIEYGRFAAVRGAENKTIYVGEGMMASVAVSEMPDGTRNYHNAGKVQASSHPADMRLQRMLGHLTHLVPKEPKSILVIGCGAGVTAGAVSIGPRTTKVTIAEIEKLVPQVVSKHFGKFNYEVVDNPKVHVRIDDGRHFLLTTKEKFDGITSDPLDPWVKGAAALYTVEFFELAKQHLNPGGVVTQFVQLYESNEEAVKSEIATFFKVFPNATVWANTVQGQGYDVVLLGQVEPTKIDVDEMEARLASPEYAVVAQSLREIGMINATDLFSTFAGGQKDLDPWMNNAQINWDRNLRLQYLAGFSLNQYQADPIYVHMVANLRYPEGLFSGNPIRLEQIRRAIQPSSVPAGE